MANRDWIVGWEHRYCTSGPGTVVWDSKKARSGRGFIKFRQLTAAAPTAAGEVPKGDIGMTSGVLPMGSGGVRTRFYLRAPNLTLGLPSSQMSLWRVQFISATDSVGVCLNPDGTIEAFVTTASGVEYGISGPVGLIVPSISQWYRFDIVATCFNYDEFLPGTDSPDSIGISVSMTPEGADGSPGTTFHAKTLPAYTVTSILMSGGGLISRPSQAPFSSAKTYELDFDDWVLRASDTAAGSTIHMPTSTRVALAMPIGAGPNAGWAGNWWETCKTANTANTDPQQSVTGIGAQTDFQMQRLDDVAPDAFRSAGVMLYWYGSAGGIDTGIPTPGFLLNGAVVPGVGAVPVAVPTLAAQTSIPFHCSIEDRPAATFNSIRLGVQSVSTGVNRLFGFLCEVLHDGRPRSLETEDDVGFMMRFVEWTGDGTSRRTISGVGFRGQFFQCWPIGTNGTSPPWVRTPDMPPGWGMKPNGAETGEFVTNITADTFDIIGTLANQAGVHYVCLVCRDDGNAVGGRIFGSGSWAGPSRVETWAFPEGAWQADVMFAVRELATSGTYFKHRLMGTDSYRADSGGIDAAQAIVSINANGVTTGTTAAIGTAARQTFWWGFRITAEAIAAGFIQGKVNGQAADAVISLAPHAPYAVFLRGTGSTPMYFRLDESEFTGANSLDYDGGAIGFGGGIIAFDQVAGTFTIDGNAVHLDDAPLVDAYYFALQQAAAPPPPPPPPEPPPPSSPPPPEPPPPIVVLPPIPPPEQEWPVDNAIAGLAIPLWWAEIYLDSGQVNVATAELEDPADYYGGYKEARILDISPIRRALSGLDGTPETAQFKLTLSDLDGLFRGMLADGAHFLHRVVIVRGANDLDRRIGGRPRIFGIGTIEDYGTLTDRRFFLQCKDYFAMFSGYRETEQNIPRGIRTVVGYPSLPAPLIGKAGQWVFGEMIEAAADENAPVLNGDPLRGSFYTAVPTNLEAYKLFPKSLWFMGWGNIPGGPAPPTNLVIVASAGGTMNPGDFPSDQLYVMVTSVNSSGLEGDPIPFGDLVSASVFVTVAGSKIDVSWTASPDAAMYRVYIGYDFFNLIGGPGGMQYLEAAASPVSFTAAPRHGVAAAVDAVGPPAVVGNVTPGAKLVTHVRSRFYRVVARTTSGLTSASGVAWTKSHPYNRPAYIEWNPVPNAIDYTVYAEDTAEGVAANKYARKFTTTDTFLQDDFSDTTSEAHGGPPGASGAVKCVPVGLRVAADGSLWHEYEICRHPVYEVLAVFYDGIKVGAESLRIHALIPGLAGYSEFFPEDSGTVQYRVRPDGSVSTCIYGRGEISDQVFKGERVLTCNVRGVISDEGYFLTDGYDIYLYMLKNMIVTADEVALAPMADGDGPFWPDSGVWEDAAPVFDEDAFEHCKAIGQDRIEGGYTLAFVLGVDGEQLAVKELLRRLNVSLGCFSGWNRKMQYFVTVIDETIDLVDTTLFTQTSDIIGASFDMKDDSRALENVMHYSALYDHVRKAWAYGDQLLRDPISIAAHREERKSQKLEFWYTRNLAQVGDILVRRSRLTRVPVRTYPYRVGLPGTEVELGDVVRTTHDDGIGVDGYIDNPGFIISHELNLKLFQVTLNQYDVSRLGFVPVAGGPPPLPLPATEQDFQMANMGGSKTIAMKSDNLTEYAIDWAPLTIDWAIYVGWTFTVTAECKTENAATSIVPQVLNEGGAVVVAGAACTATLETYVGTNQRQPLVIPSGVGVQVYILQGLRNNLANLTFLQGTVRGVAP